MALIYFLFIILITVAVSELSQVEVNGSIPGDSIPKEPSIDGKWLAEWKVG